MSTPTEIIATLRLKDQLTASLKKAEKQVGNLDRTMGKNRRTVGDLNTRMSRLGKVGLAAIGVSAAAAGVALISMFKKGLVAASEFERETTKIITLVGVAEAQVQEWSKELDRLGVALGKSPQELARALFVVTSAGERTANAIRIVEKAAKASAIGLGDTASIARTVTAAMQAYKKSGLDAATATDILVATVREGNLEAAELSGSLGRVIGIASQVGVSFAEVGGFIATFTRLGVNAEEAVTALRGILSTIIKPSKEARLQLKELGLSVDDLRKSIREKGLAQTLVDLVEIIGDNQDAFGAVIPNVRALAGVLGTAAAQGKEYIDVTTNIKDSNRILEDAMDRAAETTAQKWAVISEEWSLGVKNIGASTANALVFVQDLIGFFGKIQEGVNEIIPSFKELSENAAITGEQLAQSLQDALNSIPPVQQAMRDTAEAAKDQFDAAAIVAKELAAAEAAQAKNLGQVAKELLAAKEETDKLKDASQLAGVKITDMALALEILAQRAAEARRTIEPLSKDLDKVVASLGRLPGPGEDAAAALVAATNAADTFGPSADILARASAIAVEEITDLALANEILRVAEEELGLETRNLTGEARNLLGVNKEQRSVAEALGGGAIPRVTGATIDWGKAMDGVNDFLSESRGLMTLLGIEADSTFGKIIGWLSKVFDAFNSLIGIIGKVLGILGKKSPFGEGGLFGGLTKALGGLFGGGGIPVGEFVGPLTEAGTQSGVGFLSGFGATMSKGLAGLGKTLAPFFTNPFTIAIGAGIAGFFLLKGLFGGRDAGTVMEEAGRDMGVTLSDALAKQIFESGKNIQFFLPEIFAEGMMSVDRFAEEIGDLFSLFEQGGISKPALIAELERTIPILIANLEQLGPAGEEQIQRIIAAAKAMGVEFEGLGDLIQSQFAPSTVQEMKKQFGLTNKEVKELAKTLGIKIQTDIQRMAASVGLSTKEFKALGKAVEEKYGIPIKELLPFLESMGVSAEELGKALGVDVAGGSKGLGESMAGNQVEISGAADQAGRLAEQLERAARASGNISIPAIPNIGGGVVAAQHGLDITARRPTFMPLLFGEAGPERLRVTPLRGEDSESSAPTSNLVVNVSVSGVVVSRAEDLGRAIAPGIRAAIRDNMDGSATAVKQVE